MMCCVESSSGVQTKVVQADFTEGSQSLYDRILDELKGLEIGVLINNVGVSYEHPDYFCEVTTAVLWQLVNVNVAAVTLLTRALLPSMVERKRGAVINVASFAGYYPMGLLSVYSATKSYMNTFTQALQQEYHGKGVTIQLVTPLLVVSKLSKVKRPSFFIPTADRFVHQAIRTIGCQRATLGCIPHELQGWFLSVIPSWLRNALFFNLHKSMMKRAKAKKNKSQ